MLNFTNPVICKIELPVNAQTWKIPMQNQIELNGKVFRKAVITAKWSKWYESEVLVLFSKDSFVTVLCEDGSSAIVKAENVSYL